VKYFYRDHKVMTTNAIEGLSLGTLKELIDFGFTKNDFPFEEAIQLNDGIYLYNPETGGYVEEAQEDAKRKEAKNGLAYQFFFELSLEEKLTKVSEELKREGMTVTFKDLETFGIDAHWEEAGIRTHIRLRDKTTTNVALVKIGYHEYNATLLTTCKHLKEKLQEEVFFTVIERIMVSRSTKPSNAWRLYFDWLNRNTFETEQSTSILIKKFSEDHRFGQETTILTEYTNDFEALEEWVSESELDLYRSFVRKNRLSYLLS
jgi:hypothetical protein